MAMNANGHRIATALQPMLMSPDTPRVSVNLLLMVMVVWCVVCYLLT